MATEEDLAAEIVLLKAQLSELAIVLQADQEPNKTLVQVAEDRMYWRERHAKEAEAAGRRAADNWQRMKLYEQKLIDIIDAAKAMKVRHGGDETCCYGCAQDVQQKAGADRMASIAWNGLSALLSPNAAGPRRV